MGHRLRTPAFYARWFPMESDTPHCNAISREIDMVIFPREALTTLPRFHLPPRALVNTFLLFEERCLDVPEEIEAEHGSPCIEFSNFPTPRSLENRDRGRRNTFVSVILTSDFLTDDSLFWSSLERLWAFFIIFG